MAQLQNVTVNGQSAQQYLSKKKSEEIARFIADEIWSFGKMCSRHCCSHTTTSRQYKPKPLQLATSEELRNLDHTEGEV